MTARIFLGPGSLLWLPYIIHCRFQLGALADRAGAAERRAISGGRHA